MREKTGKELFKDDFEKAVEKQETAKIMELLQSPFAKPPHCARAFLEACAKGNTDLVTQLLHDPRLDTPEVEAEINEMEEMQEKITLVQYAYGIAVECEQSHIIKILEESPRFKAAQKESSPFFDACEVGDSHKMAELLSQGDMQGEKLGQGMGIVCRLGHVEATALLLGAGVEPPDDALSLACENNNTAMVRLLLEWRGNNGRRVDLNLSPDRTIGEGLNNGNAEMVRMLLDAGGKPPENGLVMACDTNSPELLRLMLDWRDSNGNRLPVNDRFRSKSLGEHERTGAAPLDIACLNGNAEMVRMLLGRVVPHALHLNITIASGNQETTRELLRWRDGNGERLDPKWGLEDHRPHYFRFQNDIEDKCYQNYVREQPARFLLQTWSLDYFTTQEEVVVKRQGKEVQKTVGEVRKAAFVEFPLLHEMLAREMTRQETTNTTLPEALQSAIDKEDRKKVTRALWNLPSSENQSITNTAIATMLAGGDLKPEWLPQQPPSQKQDQDAARREWRREQEAFYAVLGACINLADELGFKFDRYRPETYPPFLTQLMQNTAASLPNKWQEKAAGIPKELYREAYQQRNSNIKDAVDDFVKTVFLPHEIQRHKSEYIPGEGKKIQERIYAEAVTDFLQGVSIGAVYAFSAHWHDHRTRAKLNEVKTFTNDLWQPLFESPVRYSQVTAVPLTSSAELKKEGDDLHHCVGGYTQRCLQESSHIVSFRDESGKSLSTLELQLKPGQGEGNNKNVINIKGQPYYHLTLEQHYGNRNAPPPQQCLETEEKLFDDIREGRIKVDLSMLEQQRQIRDNAVRGRSDIILIGYDPEKAECVAEATAMYREAGIINSTLRENFDRLTAIKQEEVSQGHAARVKRGGGIDPATAIQEYLGVLLDEGQVVVSIDKSDSQKNRGYGEVVIRLAEGGRLTGEALKEKLGEILARTPAKISLEGEAVRIEGLAPMAVANSIKGQLPHAGRIRNEQGRDR